MSEKLGMTTSSVLLGMLGDHSNHEAWTGFVERYTPLIHRWCSHWGLQPADAENVTQEVLYILARKIQQYDRMRGSFRTWLRTIARNAWVDYLKGQSRPRGGSGDTAVLDQLSTVEAREELVQILDRQFDLELLEEALARVRLRVSPRDWDIYQALQSGESSQANALAERYGLNIGTVFVVKTRVLKKLREEVARLEAGEG